MKSDRQETPWRTRRATRFTPPPEHDSHNFPSCAEPTSSWEILSSGWTKPAGPVLRHHARCCVKSTGCRARRSLALAFLVGGDGRVGTMLWRAHAMDTTRKTGGASICRVMGVVAT